MPSRALPDTVLVARGPQGSELPALGSTPAEPGVLRAQPGSERGCFSEGKPRCHFLPEAGDGQKVGSTLYGHSRSCIPCPAGRETPGEQPASGVGDILCQHRLWGTLLRVGPALPRAGCTSGRVVSCLRASLPLLGDGSVWPRRVGPLWGVRPAKRSEPGRQSERPSRRRPLCWPRARPGTWLRAFRGRPRSHRHNPAPTPPRPVLLPPLPQRQPWGPFRLGRLLTFTRGSWPSCSGDGQLCFPAQASATPTPTVGAEGEEGPGESCRQPTPEEPRVRWFLGIETRLFSLVFPGTSLTTLHTGRVFWVEGQPAEGACRRKGRGSRAADRTCLRQVSLCLLLSGGCPSLYPTSPSGHNLPLCTQLGIWCSSSAQGPSRLLPDPEGLCMDSCSGCSLHKDKGASRLGIQPSVLSPVCAFRPRPTHV